MKKYIFTCLILFLIILCSGCINNDNNNQTQVNSTYKITDKDFNTKHYEDNEISFDYPNSWNLNANNYSVTLFNSKKQVIIEKPAVSAAHKTETVSATVPLPKEVVSTETIKVDGINAQKVVYKSKGGSGPSRIEINMNKNGRLFKIYCYAPPAEFNSAQEDFNLIIDSIKLK